ncbi:general secretion pathway protein GspK [Candidatus Sumerlaeota bacterium]|nr:general secretion pathway protein GspK [Candidatus Sumerlaeota bacterium]
MVTIPRTKHRRQRGFILVLTLGMLLMLSMMAVRLITDVSRELHIARSQRDSQAAFNLARAGIGRAVNDLQNDMLLHTDKELLQEHPATDSLNDFWADHPSKDEPEQLNDGVFWYITVDEESKLSINLCSPEIIKAALLYLGMEDEMDAERLAGAIYDWRDDNGVVQFLSEESKESIMDEYEEIRDYVETEEEQEALEDNKQRADQISEVRYYGYRNRNENILFMDELLEVNGVTPELLYGYDPEKEYRENPFPLPDDDEESAPWRFDIDERQLGLAQLFTASPVACINMNTANFDSLAVLFMLHTDYDIDKAQNLAEDVVKWREDRGYRRFNDANIFYQLEDLGQVPELTTAIDKANGKHPVGFKSSYFTIYAFGQYANSRSFISATVNRQLYRFPIALLEVDEYDLEQQQILKDQLASRVMREGALSEEEAQQDISTDFYESPAVICEHWVEW